MKLHKGVACGQGGQKGGGGKGGKADLGDSRRCLEWVRACLACCICRCSFMAIIVRPSVSSFRYLHIPLTRSLTHALTHSLTHPIAHLLSPLVIEQC